MLLPDVTVLVYAFRKDAVDHRHYRAWLDGTVNGDSSYACSDLVLSGFVRIVTHPRIFRDPSPLAEALTFACMVRNQPICRPGLRPVSRTPLAASTQWLIRRSRLPDRHRGLAQPL